MLPPVTPAPARVSRRAFQVCYFGFAGFLLLAAVGGIVYLFQSGMLTKEKVGAIKLLLGPATTQQRQAPKPA